MKLTNYNQLKVPTPQVSLWLKLKLLVLTNQKSPAEKGNLQVILSTPHFRREGVGVIKEADPASNFKAGQKVAMMMTRPRNRWQLCAVLLSTQRIIDSAGDESGLVNRGCFARNAPNGLWFIKGLNVVAGDKVLIRGGLYTVGLMAAVLAKDMGASDCDD